MARLLLTVGVCVVAAGAAAAQESWQAQYHEAQRLFDAGELQKAITLLDRSVQAHERVAALFCLRARCLQRAGNHAGAQADAQRAIELEPGIADAWVERGYARMCQGDLAGAIADFDEAIRLASRHVVAFGDRGDARQRQGDWLGARADYDAALRIDPRFGAALHNRAIVNMGLGVWAAAARDQARAIELCAPYWRMWSILATAQEQLGRWHRVLASVEQGLACEGADVVVLLAQRAHAHWRLGEHAAAIAARENAVPAADSAAATAIERLRVGCLQLAAGQSDAARVSFAACASDAAMRPWTAVMTWCLGADNATADRELRAAVAAWPTDTAAAATRLAQDCLEPVELADPTSSEEVERVCAAAFLRGWRARRDGRADEARRWFATCVDTGCTYNAQWEVAYALLGLRADAPAALGCELRAVPDADPPRLEVAALVPGGPAALQGLRVGDRIAMVGDQPATLDKFAAATRSLVIGTPVRFALEGDGKRAEHWVRAGIGAR
jgi:tetratricopeptide (TPR) repeat protein